MSMPIQRQNDAYGVFDDGQRFAREHTTRDLPEGLVNMLKGPRISAGLNNPRGIGERRADAFAREDMGGHAHYDPEMEARDHAGFGEDHAGFGQDPSQHIPESYVEQPQAAAMDPSGFGFGGYDDYDPHSSENLPPDYGAQFDPHMGSFPEARRLTADDGPAPGLFTPMLHQPGERLDARSTLYGGEDAGMNAAPSAGPAVTGTDWVTAAAAVTPQVVPGWVGHGYAPGHRVGLPWRQQVIPGTVTHLDGQQLGVRWDDGQHSTEEPSDLRPL
jgi:hypothetical protein